MNSIYVDTKPGAGPGHYQGRGQVHGHNGQLNGYGMQ